MISWTVRFQNFNGKGKRGKEYYKEEKDWGNNNFKSTQESEMELVNNSFCLLSTCSSAH